MGAFLAPATPAGQGYLAQAEAGSGAVINLVAADLVAGRSIGAVAVSVAAPAVVDLVAAPMTAGRSISTASIGVVAPSPGIVNLLAASLTAARSISIAAVTVTPPGETSMSFTASALRTVLVGAGSKPFTAGELWNMSDPKKPRAPKDPDATTDYSFNWTPWLLDVVDSIASHTILTTEGLVDLGSSAVGSVITVFLSGGNPGKRAEVTCRITTSSTPPRVEDRTIFLDIESR